MQRILVTGGAGLVGKALQQVVASPPSKNRLDCSVLSLIAIKIDLSNI